MQIVIDIPKERYELMKEKSMFGRVDVWKDALRNGTPLPKRHGRLIDVDKMIDDFKGSKAISLAERFKIANIVEHQQTIIEADREVDE